MSKMIRNRAVGMYIENHEATGGKPVLILYVDHVWLRKEYENAEGAEYAYAELADVFDLWLEDMPKWIPPRGNKSGNTSENNSGQDAANACPDTQNTNVSDDVSLVREGGLEPPHG